MFTGQDTKNMETMLLPHIKDAIAMIETARAWLGKAKLIRYPALATILRCRMEVRLVMYIHCLAKKISTIVQFASIEAIGQQLTQEVKDNGGDISESPWKIPPAAPAVSAQPEEKGCGETGNTILEFDADGSMNHKQIQDMFGIVRNSRNMTKTIMGI